MIIKNIFSNLGIISKRTENIAKQIVLSFIFKVGTIVINFLLVPLILNYLDTTNYGIWLVITSFIGWFSFIDGGLGHGLRNKFTEAKALGDAKLVKGYISSAYFMLSLISLVLILLFGLTNSYINWTVLFNTEQYLQKDLSILMFIVVSIFCIQLVAKLITTIYTADQKPSVVGIVNFSTQLISLISIWCLLKYSQNSLLLFGFIFSIIPAIILIIVSLFSFNKKYKEYTPILKLWKKKYINDIFGLGSKFFIIQIAAVILYSTDNIIIAQLFGPDEVIPYALTFKYFSIVTILFSTIATPYWSAITEAYTKREFNWIKVSINNLLLIVGASVLLVAIMILFSDRFFSLWIGGMIKIPFLLTFLMGLFAILSLFIQPFIFFINGTGKIQIQLIIGVTMAIANIPLSIYFSKYIGLGVEGVILATIICSILGMIVFPLQYFKIVNNNAKGIWNL